METLPPLFPDRQFFNIGEAARIVQVPDYTLRYWESRVRLLRPARRESGHRRYTKRDLETILRVKELVRERGMSLTGARHALLRESRRAPSAGETPLKPPGAAAEKLLRELRQDLNEILAELSK